MSKNLARMFFSYPITHVFFGLLTYFLAVFALDRFDWGQGQWRAGVLAVIALLMIVLPKPASVFTGRPLAMVLAVVVLLGVGIRTIQFVISWHANSYHPVDIATTTLTAVPLIARLNSPYLYELDEAVWQYKGYKYGPLMPVVYFPLVQMFGTRGLFLTNFLFYLACGAILVALGAKRASNNDWGAGWFVALLWFATPLVWRELMVAGTNDAIALLPALGALLAHSYNRQWLAGILLGLSIVCKVLPGGIFLLALLPAPGRWRVLAGMALTAELAALPHLMVAPRELWQNVVLSMFVSTPDSTALRYFLPAGWGSVVVVSIMIACLVLFIRYIRAQNFLLGNQVRFLVIFLCFFFLMANVHRNYLLWLVPLLAVEMGVFVMGEVERAKRVRLQSAD